MFTVFLDREKLIDIRSLHLSLTHFKLHPLQPFFDKFISFGSIHSFLFGFFKDVIFWGQLILVCQLPPNFAEITRTLLLFIKSDESLSSLSGKQSQKVNQCLEKIKLEVKYVTKKIGLVLQGTTDSVFTLLIRN